jgi:hypothetical protein
VWCGVASGVESWQMGGLRCLCVALLLAARAAWAVAPRQRIVSSVAKLHVLKRAAPYDPRATLRRTRLALGLALSLGRWSLDWALGPGPWAPPAHRLNRTRYSCTARRLQALHSPCWLQSTLAYVATARASICTSTTVLYHHGSPLAPLPQLMPQPPLPIIPRPAQSRSASLSPCCCQPSRWRRSPRSTSRRSRCPRWP